MNRQELLSLHSDMCQRARAIMQAKNQDYSPGDSGVFGNLLDSRVFDVEPPTGILIRIMDKLKRLHAYQVNGSLAVKDEQLEDTAVDVINYIVLLSAYYKDRQGIQIDLKQEVDPFKSARALDNEQIVDALTKEWAYVKQQELPDDTVPEITIRFDSKYPEGGYTVHTNGVELSGGEARAVLDVAKEICKAAKHRVGEANGK